MRRTSDEAFQNHNDTAAYARAKREQLFQEITPEQMIEIIREKPDPNLFAHFNAIFQQIMNAQLTIHGADSVMSDWNRMRNAFEGLDT